MYEEMTQESIVYEMMEDTELNLYKGEGGTLYNMYAPVATQLAKMYALFSQAMEIAFLTNNNLQALDERLADFGEYRKEGEKADGEVIFNAPIGTQINNGELITFSGLDFIILQDINMSTTSVNVKVKALEEGKKFNLPAGTEFESKNNNIYVDKIIAIDDFKNGLDKESDEEFYNRHLWEMQNKPTSGNEAHFIKWAKEVKGVTIAKSNPEWNGEGHVKLLITGENGKPVSSEIITNTKKYIEEKRPVGVDVIVITSTLKEINIKAEILKEKGFDINDIKLELQEKINNYLSSISNEIIYVKILALMASSIAVIDIKKMLINDLNSNIIFSSEEIPFISLELKEVE